MVPGFFWFDPLQNGGPRIVRVVERQRGMGLAFVATGKSGALEPVYAVPGRWAGPIALPQ